MADNYTLFSVTLPVPKPGSLPISDWLRSQREAAEAVEDEDSLEEYDETYNCYFEATPGSGEVWIYSDGEGSVEAAAYLTQKYLSDYDIEGGVLITWASYCSKPRVNEAFGGAVLVTKTGMLYQNSFDLCKEASEAGIEVLNV